MMNECRESDSLIVSGKSSNKICDSKHMAEKMERRREGGWPKGIELSKTRAGR